MSDTLGTDMTDTLDDTDTTPHDLRSQLRDSGRARAEAEGKATAAEARAAAAERELAFTKAGIPDGKLGEMFMKSYEGEMDAESIKTAAAEIGIGGASPTDPHTEAADPMVAELAARRRAAGATGAATVTTAAGNIPGTQADYESRIRSATSEREVMAIVAEAQSNHPDLGIYVSGLE
jgi:hypothetical protein